MILNQFDKDGISIAKLFNLDSQKWYDVEVTVNNNNVTINFSESSSGGGSSGFPLDIFIADLQDTYLREDGYNIIVPGIYNALSNGKFVIFTNWRCLNGKGNAFNTPTHLNSSGQYEVLIQSGEFSDGIEMYIDSEDNV